MPQHPQRFWLAAFIVAGSVDILFWGKPAGISFMVFVLLALLAGYAMLYSEKLSAARSSYLLSGLIVLFAALTIFRATPFARFLNGFVALLALGLLVLTLRSGAWLRIRMIDYFSGGFELLLALLSRGSRLRLAPEAREGGSPTSTILRQATPVIRGLLLALPVVIILGALLSSADLIFADQVAGLFSRFDLSNLPEFLFRLLYVLALSYAFAGLYSYAALPKPILHAQAASNQGTPGEAAPAPVPAEAAVAPRRILGPTEGFIVLGSVDLLFAFFVAVQVRYLFGGQANINASGYTFSEYARRGFFELVMVAVITLLLVLLLGAVTRRSGHGQEQAFTALMVLLVVQVWVILASAFQRLLLYEGVYGFTRLRTYTHVFIPWLGFLLLATIVLQLLRRERLFGGLLMLTVFGFTLSMGLINVDGLIVEQNAASARSGKALDSAYLLSLSDDALPAMIREFSRPDQTEEIRDSLGVVLSCWRYRAAQQQPQPWQSFHPGSALAMQSLRSVDLSGFTVQAEKKDNPYVSLGNTRFSCNSNLIAD